MSKLWMNWTKIVDSIFECIECILSKYSFILIQISLKYICKGPVDNSQALAQVACRPFGAKPLPEPMMTSFTDAYMRHSVPMS